MVSWDCKVHNSANSLFFLFYSWLLQDRVVWLGLGDPFVCQNPRGVCASHFPGQILGCAYTICLYGQISISCTITSGSTCPPSHVLSCTLSVQVCYFHLSCDWSFRLHHHIIINTYSLSFSHHRLLKFEWQQVSSGLQDFSEYSTRS